MMDDVMFEECVKGLGTGYLVVEALCIEPVDGVDPIILGGMVQEFANKVINARFLGGSTAEVVELSGKIALYVEPVGAFDVC